MKEIAINFKPTYEVDVQLRYVPSLQLEVNLQRVRETESVRFGSANGEFIVALEAAMRGLTGTGGAAYARRHHYVAPYSYLGIAADGSEDTAPVWRITRIDIAPDGTTTQALAVDAAWTDRLTVTYT
jgi:hypothetical protein